MKKNKFLLTLAQTEEYLYSSYEMTKQLRELYERREKEKAFRQFRQNFFDYICG